MSAILAKLQFKGAGPILVTKAPTEFEPHLEGIGESVRVLRRASGKKRYPLVLTFVRTCAELARSAAPAVDRVEEDGLLWFAYPKKSSKRYDSDIGRDDSWQPLGDLGYEGVRMIAIDDDWSALRLRRVEHIRSMKRDPKRAMTPTGKRKASGRHRS